MDDAQNPKYENLVVEYQALKNEQTQRIAFRDNILFVHIAACGAVGSWAITNIDTSGELYALLIVPWLSVILGWTYLVNDHAISKIGSYFLKSSKEISELSPATGVVADSSEKSTAVIFFRWEIYHRTDGRRISRKCYQYAIDLLTFCGSGVASILCFYNFSGDVSAVMKYLCFFECVLMAWLAIQLFIYSDIRSK